ncbi:hypothetical protein AX16_001671 [Volvariella volvacea WC 439]|nr:hypothetical protein AX16_001671 [Volvariella volvacea WC 439]
MPVHPNRILVVGAGPAGLVALRNLTERGSFGRVELVERRDDVGGVWYLDNPPPSTPQRPRWPSPAYPGLIGNVLSQYLSYSDFPFPPPDNPDQPFPTLSETHRYLQDFAKPFIEKGSIRLNVEVVSVTELGPESGAAEREGEDDRSYGWKVVLKDWNDGQGGKVVEEIWDGVVIANGWYDTPAWPDTPGLDELRKRDLARHAKWWRSPRGYEGKKVIVVGNANSSNDIAAQLAPIVPQPVYQSIRRPAFPGFPSLPNDNIKMVAPIKQYTLQSGKITAELTDGTTLDDIDVVLYGTGYAPRADFVRIFDPSPPSSSSSTPRPLIPLTSPSITPFRVPHLHRHILYAYNPSLAFIGSTLAFTPFTIADLASTWLALAWSRQLAYPRTPAERLVYESERLAAVSAYRATMDTPSSLMVYNVLGEHEQEYAIGLRGDVERARRDLADKLPVWSEERTKEREGMYPLKLKALEWARERGVVGNRGEVGG